MLEDSQKFYSCRPRINSTFALTVAYVICVWQAGKNSIDTGHQLAVSSYTEP